MQNRTKSVDIFHIPDLPPTGFPISIYGTETYSPSSEPIFNIHFHDSLEIGYCYEGEGTFFVDGKLIPFTARDVSIIFKNQLHIAQSDSLNISKWKFVSIIPELLLAELPLDEINTIFSILTNTTAFPNILTYTIYPRTSQLVLNLVEELINKLPGYKSYIKSLVWQLFIEIGRISPNTIDLKPLLKNNIKLLSPALEYISNNYMNHLEVSTLAAICNTSDRNLRRLFVKSLHLSPQDYIIKFRIHMASSLLRTTDDSVINISCSVGFSTLSSFNRHFKKLIGVSPKKWRVYF